MNNLDDINDALDELRDRANEVLNGMHAYKGPPLPHITVTSTGWTVETVTERWERLHPPQEPTVAAG